MARRYATYAFFIRQPDDRPHPEVLRVEAHLHRHHPSLRPADAATADLLFVFGGDGTLLDALRTRGAQRQHVVALNTGHAGFLTTVREADRFTDAVDRAVAGALLPVPMPIMAVTLRTAGGTTVSRAVNDVLVECTMTWLGLHVESVRRGTATFVKDVRGSGVCVCSAVGSTSPMAAHHHVPPMEPGVRALFVRGIHDMTSPAAGVLLAADRRTLRLTLASVEPNPGIPEEHRRPPALFLDGIHAGVMSAGDVIEIAYAPRSPVLLRLPEETHWDRVRSLHART
jgi:NAD kinase